MGSLAPRKSTCSGLLHDETMLDDSLPTDEETHVLAPM
jgi:hypothetical protein